MCVRVFAWAFYLVRLLSDWGYQCVSMYVHMGVLSSHLVYVSVLACDQWCVVSFCVLV